MAKKQPPFCFLYGLFKEEPYRKKNAIQLLIVEIKRLTSFSNFLHRRIEMRLLRKQLKPFQFILLINESGDVFSVLLNLTSTQMKEMICGNSSVMWMEFGKNIHAYFSFLLSGSLRHLNIYMISLLEINFSIFKYTFLIYHHLSKYFTILLELCTSCSNF